MDEGFYSVINFVQSEISDPEWIVSQGEPLLAMLVVRLDDLGGQTGVSEFSMGALISKYRTNKAWEQVAEYQDWWKFGDFCREKLKMSQQKAMILFRNWEKSQVLNISPDTVNEIPWHVMDKILKVAKTRDEADELLTQFRHAESSNIFLANLKENGNGKKEHIPKKRRQLKLTETDERFFDETLERLAERMGQEVNRTLSQEDAVLAIFREWRQDHAGE
jgi:hypothetical protein